MIQAENKKINFIWPMIMIMIMIMIIVGVLFLCSIFWIDFGCDNSLSAGQCSQELHFDFIIIGIPMFSLGIIFICIGLIKLNKYFKYIKS